MRDAEASAAAWPLDLDALDFTKGNGLVTVVAQDASTGAVLMVAHADREALDLTLRTGEMHYRSRSRGPWHKGATSGNVQHVVRLVADCDGDAVLAVVRPAGPACHTGSQSCFGAAEVAVDGAAGGSDAIPEMARRISERARESHALPGMDTRPESYTRRLLADRNLRLKKLGEEAAELAVACADEDRERAAEEVADLLYHAMVALTAVGGSLEDVQRALGARAAPPPRVD